MSIRWCRRQRARVLAQPANRKHCIFDAGGKAMLRRQAILNRQDCDVRRQGQLAAEDLVALDVADYPTAAVKPDEDRQGGVD